MTATTDLPDLSDQPPTRCSACGAVSPPPLGDKDFAYSCNDHFEGAAQFPRADAPVRYSSDDYAQIIKAWL